MAIGIDVVPMLMRSNTAFTPGKIASIPTPRRHGEKNLQREIAVEKRKLRKSGVCAIAIVTLIRNLLSG